MSAALVTLLVENACIGRSARELAVPQLRRDVTRELEHQIQRALWRADRRGRGLPLEVKQSAGWVNAQRRKIAWELFRALRAMGAGAELAAAAADVACQRFPRDGVIIADVDPRRPRERGESPRQRAKNPRARGASPRQRGTSPRQRRQSLKPENSQQAAGSAAIAPLAPNTNPAVVRPTGDARERAKPSGEHAPRNGAPAAGSPRALEELAPGWADLKAQLLADMTDDERSRARKAAAVERERLERVNRRQDHDRPTT